MRILLISSAFSGLTQRFFIELEDAGYTVSIELHLGNTPQLLEGVELFRPDLIICPFLTRRIPEEIYVNYKCIIVHPGIKGDRGPSSLDWAIQENVSEWGVTLMQAQAEMDSGDIWASKTFPLRSASKSSVFYREVTQTAIECLWEVLTYIDAPDFKPEPLDYAKPSIKGQLRPLMQQAERAINWNKHTTQEIMARLRAADGSPGVLDEIAGQPFYLFNAHSEPSLRGKPGEIIALSEEAICRATVDGAIWIGHLQPKLETGKGIKLPATQVLQGLLPKATASFMGLLSKPIKRVAPDYYQPGQQYPFQEVWYELQEEIAYLHFPFHNGAMNTEQCQLLLSVYQHIATLSVKVIILMGGDEFWSNGIHLNDIEANVSPADASWSNINAIDDLIYQIITTLDKLTIAAVAGNAGAGGAILALAADLVFAREGIILNPHYKNMGELYGSEYWTYLLPKRIGQEQAIALTEQRLPISAKKAWRMGLIDKVLDKQHKIFHAQIKYLAHTYCSDTEFRKHLTAKAKTRCYDEAIKPLAAYRQFELTQMYANFYGNDAYHAARRNFVFKQNGATTTSLNIALHRRPEDSTSKVAVGSMTHFVWDDIFYLDNTVIDRQHKDLFTLANQLMLATNFEEMTRSAKLLYLHVQKHFDAEEAVMQKLVYQDYKAHIHEHNLMLEQLTHLNHKIAEVGLDWNPRYIQEFVASWEKHIMHADTVFNQYVKKQQAEICE